MGTHGRIMSKRKTKNYKRYEVWVEDVRNQRTRRIRVDAIHADVARQAVLRFPEERITVKTLPDWSFQLRAHKPLFSSRELLIIVEGLCAALSLGIGMDKALLRATTRVHTPVAIGRIAEVGFLITRKGYDLAEAMEETGGFPEDLIRSVEAGQNSGNLVEVLRMWVRRLTMRRSLGRKVVGGSAYPLLLVCIALIAFLGLGIFILPETADLFTEAGYQLPVVTRMMLDCSEWITGTWWKPLIGLLLLVLFGATLRRWIRSDHGIRFVSAIPQLGELISGLLLLRPLQTWVVLVRAGIPLPQALIQVAKVCAHHRYRVYFMNLANEMISGHSLESALRKYRRDIPEGIDLAVSLGEVTDTGNLEESLSGFLVEFEEQVDSRLTWLPKMLEPVLLSAVFLVILFIVVAAILPGLEFLRQSLVEM